MDGVVLVLNQNYEPLNVCNIPRAFRLVFGSKAEVIEYDHAEIRTVRRGLPRPVGHPPPAPDPRPRPRVKLTRREIFSPRPPHLPVLRPAGERPHARPRRCRAIAAAATRGRTSSRPASRATTARAAGPRRRRTCGLVRPPFEPRSDVYSLFTPYLEDHAQRGLADVPLPRPELSAGRARPGRRPRRRTASRAAVPRPVARGPRSASAATATPAYVVGGVGARRPPGSPSPPTGTWPPTRAPTGSSSCSRAAVYENRFGTVAVRRDASSFEITTFRTDHDYADHRRPHRVEFGDDLRADLARRDFTVNAMAWGGARDRPTPRRTPRQPWSTPSAASTTSASARSAPSATRRAVPRGRAAHGSRGPPRRDPRLRDRARDARGDRGQRRPRRAPLRRARRRGARAAARGDRAVGRPAARDGHRAPGRDLRPELAAQRGIRQNKIPGEDLWDHTLRTVDAAPATRPIVRLAALLHDIGKPDHARRRPIPPPRRRRAPGSPTRSCAGCGSRGRRPRTSTHLVAPPHVHRGPRRLGRGDPAVHQAHRPKQPRRRCSSSAAPTTSAAACRPTTRRPPRFRARVDAQLAARPPLDRDALAVDGDDLIRRARAGPGTIARPRARRAARTRHRRPGAQRPRHAAAARTGHACGHAATPRSAMIELLLQAERALSVGLRRPGRAPVPPGRRRRIRATRSPSWGWRGSRSNGPTTRRRWRQAKRALAIDPENVAAQRLVGRLEEVFATRGEPLPRARGGAGTVRHRRAMKVLVTGGAGYVGGVSVDAILGRRPRRRRPRRPHHGPRERSPTRTRASSSAATATTRSSRPLLAAGAASTRSSIAPPARSSARACATRRRYYRDNVAGGIALLEAARAAGVGAARLLVHRRGLRRARRDADRGGRDRSGRSTRTARRSAPSRARCGWYGAAYGLRSVSLRYFNVAGATRAARRGPPPGDAPHPERAHRRGGRAAR